MKKTPPPSTLSALIASMAWVALVPFSAEADCSLSQPPNMNLGTYTGALSTVGSTTLTVRCNGNNPDYTIPLTAGTGVGATTLTRKLTGPASSTLNYRLFRDAARAQNWGNILNVDTVSGSGSVKTANFTIYPQIPAGQLVEPGTYVDTISSATRTFTVTALVQPMCQITATDLAFGTYTGVALDAVSTLTIACTNTTGYYVNLNDGQQSDANYLPRAIGPGGALLSYTMFQDAARSLRWGNTYNLDGVAGTGSGRAQALTVYGRVLAGQFVTPGAYSDVVIVTVTY